MRLSSRRRAFAPVARFRTRPFVLNMNAAHEFDVAIVGMSGRFPGAPTLQQFWKNLSEGVESITRFSDDELLAAGVPQEWIRDPRYVKAAPILEEPGAF